MNDQRPLDNKKAVKMNIIMINYDYLLFPYPNFFTHFCLDCTNYVVEQSVFPDFMQSSQTTFP